MHKVQQSIQGTDPSRQKFNGVVYRAQDPPDHQRQGGQFRPYQAVLTTVTGWSSTAGKEPVWEVVCYKGYISKEPFEMPFKYGIHLLTNIPRDMKNRLMTLEDKILPANGLS